jgi:long-chain acyl-CoA synthetase
MTDVPGDAASALQPGPLLEPLLQFQGREALIWRDRPILFDELLAGVRAWREILLPHGLGRGACVAFRGEFSPQTVMLLLALFEADCIAVPLTRAGAEPVDARLAIAAADALIDFGNDDQWQLRRLSPPRPPPLLLQLRASAHPGLILFSSGSTGEVKASLHDATRLLERHRQARRSYRCIGFLLLDHIGGLNTLASTLFGGGTLIAVADRSVATVCDAIARHRAEVLPTTPTFLTMLLIADAPRRRDLSSLSLITYGTEPMPQTVLSALRAALPRVRLKQTYGLTEVGILATRTDDAGSLWMRVGGAGFETQVRDGVLWIRARGAMLGYLNAPSPFDADGWLCTGDVVEQDGDYIRICGRRSEVINVGGEKVFPAEVENIILATDNIAEAAVMGMPSPVTGQVVVAYVRLVADEPAHQVEARVLAQCRRHLPEFKVPALVEVAAHALHSPRFKTLRKTPAAAP